MSELLCCQGRSVSAEQLSWLRDWIASHREWSRKRLARELCVLWDWRDSRGRLNDFAARSFLLKLQERGEVELPALQVQKRRPPRSVKPLAGWQEPSVWRAKLDEVQPIELEVVRTGTQSYRRWAFYLEHYHYLRWRVVGENLGFAFYDRHGRDLGCSLFGAPAWQCQVRDRFLNWSPRERAEQLPRIANNTRFLILPWVGVKHLASHVLGQIAHRISADWEQKYGHGLRWLETFVDSQRYSGACYRAANWRYVGQTVGRSRQDRHHKLKVSAKAVYLYDLSRP
jgi:hypothetical protein